MNLLNICHKKHSIQNFLDIEIEMDQYTRTNHGSLRKKSVILWQSLFHPEKLKESKNHSFSFFFSKSLLINISIPNAFGGVHACGSCDTFLWDSWRSCYTFFVGELDVMLQILWDGRMSCETLWRISGGHVIHFCGIIGGPVTRFEGWLEVMLHF